MKLVYNGLMLLLIAASVLVMPVASTFAASATPAPVSGPTLNQTSVESKITEVTDKVKAVARPVAVLSVVIIALAMIAAPAFREWAQENKGRLAGVLFGIVLLGLSGDIVEMMFS
jgi:type IV secretory pathway VirB2 component (pilin)